jgi:cation diffusion facilitator CzcD-associated flavoprotein CzcO
VLEQLANWLEIYAEAMELNVWTSSAITRVARDNSTGLYRVTMHVKGPQPGERTFTVKHVIFATGFGGGRAYMPTYPGTVDNELAFAGSPVLKG